MKFDYLIVGGGIAGSTLSYKLLLKGKKVCQISDRAGISASQVAAGMFNPLVFKRITKSWMVDTLLPAMRTFFTEIEKKFNVRLLYPMQIIKLLTEEELMRWKTKMVSGEFQDYIVEVSEGKPCDGLKDYFGFARVQGGGYINTNRYLDCIQNNQFSDFTHINDWVCTEDLIFTESGDWRWKEVSAQKIVFCEGAEAVNNSLFKEVVFYLTKGDILELEIPGLEEGHIINRQIFLLPKGQHRFICGSTYNHQYGSAEPVENEVEELISKLKKIVALPFKIINHRTGIRPTIKDRRPVLGRHTEKDRVYFFNGLGTKGLMLVPYFADQMIDFMEGNIPVDPEVKLERFYK